MASVTCGVCHVEGAKYKCPTCEMRYCSVACNKAHKTIHQNEATATAPAPAPPSFTQLQGNGNDPKPNSNPTKGTSRPSFANFEKDPDLIRLLSRYPHLKHELQLAFALTLEPGSDEERTWRSRDYFAEINGTSSAFKPQRGRGGGRGSRGGYGSIQTRPGFLSQEERQHGAWTQEKGDKQGLQIVKNLREKGQGELSEGMMEFIKLCAIKFRS